MVRIESIAPNTTRITILDRTPIGHRFIDQLIRVNDQICYSALLHHEFDTVLKPLKLSRPKDFTSTVFPRNPFAERFYRRIDELHSFGATSSVIELQTGIIAAVEYALAYLEEIQSFRAAVRPSAEDQIHKDGAEEKIFEKLSGWSGTPAPKGYFTTIGYLRLLRNHFAHARSDLSSALALSD